MRWHIPREVSCHEHLLVRSMFCPHVGPLNDVTYRSNSMIEPSERIKVQSILKALRANCVRSSNLMGAASTSRTAQRSRRADSMAHQVAGETHPRGWPADQHMLEWSRRSVPLSDERTVVASQSPFVRHRAPCSRSIHIGSET